MEIDEVLREQLLEDGAVSGLVARRIYRVHLPQAVNYPCVRLQLISEPRESHLRGPQQLIESLVQIDAFANEADAMNPTPWGTVEQLAAAIGAALTGAPFQQSGSPSTCAVDYVKRRNKFPLYESSAQRIVRMVQEFDIYWREITTAPSF